MSVINMSQETINPKIIEFCRKKYPMLANNIRACRQLYYAVFGGATKVKIADVKPDERVIIEGVVISKRTLQYDGCPDTLKKGPCEDGSLGVIKVHRMEIADETDSIWAVAITPSFSELDTVLENIEPGDIVEVAGVARSWIHPETKEERIDLMIFRRPSAVKIIETRDQRLESLEEELKQAEQPEEPEPEIVEPEPEESELVDEEKLEKIEKFLDHLRKLRYVPITALDKVLKPYGLTREDVEDFIRVEGKKVYPA